MIDTKTIMEQLTGPAMTASLIRFMEENFSDFQEIHKKYRETIAHMDNGAALAEAIDAQIASDLLFSAALGLKANLDHFRDPVARTFLEVESEVYLRESIAHSLPQYMEAQQIRDTIHINDDITAFSTYLETIGPKLAHYMGYLLGNELLPRIIPGFCCDPLLTMQYKKMTDDYLCCSLSEQH